jgi:hypothetical protein
MISIRRAATIQTDDGRYPISGVLATIQDADWKQYREMRLTARMLVADVHQWDRAATVITGFPFNHELRLQYYEALRQAPDQPPVQVATWGDLPPHLPLPNRQGGRGPGLYLAIQGRLAVETVLSYPDLAQCAWQPAMATDEGLLFRATERGEPSELFWLWVAASLADRQDNHVAVRLLDWPSARADQPLLIPVPPGRKYYLVLELEPGAVPPQITVSDQRLVVSGRRLTPDDPLPARTSAAIAVYDLPSTWTDHVMIAGLRQPPVRQAVLGIGARLQLKGLWTWRFWRR